MIKIEINMIKNWPVILDKHKEYFNSVVKDRIERIINDKFGYFKKYLNQSELNIYNHFYKNLDVIAVDTLENIFKNIATISLSHISTKTQTFKLSDFKDLDKNKTNNKKINIICKKYNISIALSVIEKYDKLKELSIFTRYHSNFGFLPYIFNYDSFDRAAHLWSRHKLISMIDVQVCPYCQRQYITNYKEESTLIRKNLVDKTTADLDHFYSQEKYPYLALSLYNFIPSCQICNSRMKGKKEFSKDTHVYPYEESFGKEYKFSSTHIHLLNPKYNKVELKRNRKFTHSDTKFYDRVEKNIEELKLDKVYADSHNEYLKDMIENIQSYPPSKLAEIDDLFQKNGIPLTLKEKKKLEFDLQDLVLKPYKDRVEKGEPLAKLTKDILEEYGITL